MGTKHDHPGLEDALGRLSDEIGSAFSVALVELATVRTAAAALGADVVRLTEAAERGRADPDGIVDSFVTNASQAATAAETAAGSLADHDFQRALVSILKSLGELKRSTIELSAISSLTRITNSEGQDVSSAIAVFTQSLDLHSGELRKCAASSSDLIGHIQRQSGQARDRLMAIGGELRAVSAHAGRQTGRLAELEAAHRTHMALVQRNAQQLGQAVARSVGELIACLQFPDAFAQRVAHMRTALEALPQIIEPGERACLSAVISAQIDAMAAALDDVCTKADKSLGTLLAIVDADAGSSAESGAHDASSIWMNANLRSQEAMLQSVDSARSQLGSAICVLADVTRQIDSARASLETSARLNLELENSVHNASIVSSRSSATKSPLRVLAGGVKEVAGRTSHLVTGISEGLLVVRAASEALEQTGLADELQTLTELQLAASQAASAQAADVGAVRDAQQSLRGQTSRLKGAASAAMSAFAAARESAEALEDMARLLAPETVAAADACDLTWLAALYTMEEERAVHREVLGIVEQEPDGAEGAEIDDFVF